tara:strand:- start:338 stop:472 length:135 start_codon:yes stop_codon:yes gene_type:complete
MEGEVVHPRAIEGGGEEVAEIAEGKREEQPRTTSASHRKALRGG